MLIKKIVYTDFNGDEQTEVAMFNLNKLELVRFDGMYVGGMEAFLKKVLNKSESGQKQDVSELLQFFEDFILKSYGVKSDDGRSFVKSPELSKAFSESAAYEKLFDDILTDENTAIAFFTGVMPTVK